MNCVFEHSCVRISECFFFIVHENTHHQPIGHFMSDLLQKPRTARITPTAFTTFHAQTTGFTTARTVSCVFFSSHTFIYYYLLYYWLFMYLLSRRFTRCSFSRTRIVRRNTRPSDRGCREKRFQCCVRREAAHTRRLGRDVQRMFTLMEFSRITSNHKSTVCGDDSRTRKWKRMKEKEGKKVRRHAHIV